MKYYNSIIDTIGDTPLVKLNSLAKGIKGTILVKVEYFNPGNSMKDRMALKMIEDAEAAGILKPGGTIIEGTSGNTGMGLALGAIAKGYKCIFTLADKQSQEKIDILRAVGAEVIVCPTNVEPEDPRSYYSVARKLNEDIENSFYPNQYDNLSNAAAHYESTGPEIWRDTEGKITHYAAGVGTGGSMCGTSKYLKEQNPDVVTVGIDTYGSVFKKYKETGQFDEKEIYPYLTEGIGEDILPKNVNFDLIDHFEKVTDRDGAIFTRRLAMEEGIMMGYSAGSAIAGLLQMKEQLTEDDLVVVILHDHGSRYVAKVYNDDWMRERGFLDTDLKVHDLIRLKSNDEFIVVQADMQVKDALELLKSHEISQMPVMEDGDLVGSLTESAVLSYILDSPVKHASEKVSAIMGEPFPVVDPKTSCKNLSKYISRDVPAVISRDSKGALAIISQYDLIQNL